MSARTRLATAVAASIVAHVAVLLQTWEERAAAPSVRTLEVELSAAQPEPPPVPPLEGELSDRVEAVSTQPPDINPALVIASEPSPEASDNAPSVLPPLDLSEPALWDGILDSNGPRGIAALPFNPGLRAGAASERAADARRSLLAGRLRAVHGMADEEFGVVRGFQSEMVKVNGRCYILKPSEGLGAEPQWWLAGCPEPRRNPFTLELIEFDAVGRVITN